MSSQREVILGRLDPEAAALLLEVASRPSSLLLSAERVALEDPHGRSPGVLTPQTPGLSRAERQLLSVHRRHLGLLLHELAAGLIWEADRFQDLLRRAHGPRRDQRPAAPATVLAQLQAPLPPALDALNLPPHGHSLTARIGSLLQGLTETGLEPTDDQIHASLALAQLLLPSVWSRMNKAFYLCRRGQARPGESLLLGLDPQHVALEGGGALWEASLATSRLGQGRFGEAALGFLGAHAKRPDPVMALFCWLAAALSQDWRTLERIKDQAGLEAKGTAPLQRIIALVESCRPGLRVADAIERGSSGASLPVRSHIRAILDGHHVD